MDQATSLQETITKGKRHYYDGLTFRKWKSAMLNMYGHDTMPFLEEAWNDIVGAAESKARSNREKQTSISKTPGAGTHAKAKQPGPIAFLADLTMLTLNAIACLALFSAWRSGLPYSFDTKLTWICFAALTYTALWRLKDGAAIICLPLACLFNPFYPINLTRSVWCVIGTLLLLVAMSFSFLAKPKK